MCLYVWRSCGELSSEDLLSEKKQGGALEMERIMKVWPDLTQPGPARPALT
jgi:hypothetical protein